MKQRVKQLNHFLLAGVMLFIFIGITLSRSILGESLFTSAHSIDFFAYMIIWITVLYIMGYFNLKKLNDKKEYFKKVFLAFVFSFLITLFVRFFENGTIISWRVNLIKNFMSSIFIAVFLFLIRILITAMSNRNILIIGGSFSGRSVAREILSTKSLNLNLVGYVSNKTSGKMKVFAGDEVKENEDEIKSKIDYLGSEEQLHNIIYNHDIKYVVIAKDREMDEKLENNLDEIKELVQIYFIDEIYELLSKKIPVLHLSKEYFYIIFRNIEKRDENFKLYTLLIRIINVALSFAGLILSLPILLIAMVVIKLGDPKGPIFFVQERIGYRGKKFKIYKLRSMIEHDPEKYPKNPKSSSDPRIKWWGKCLRKLRIDELPQFYNILKGDMNIIGPRPEQVELVEKYKKEIPFYAKRHLVRPGVTGWAQVNHDYTSNTEETIYKLQYDLYYVKNRSLFLDLLIFLKTLKIVLCGKGM
ncbi:MAG: exopolysaccharide biosynthesis polyprenyl glycosylphosphotransferase [Candidatus Mcinerneyibacterium aminivorans]|uniref:Exopolysaccharide biosynthesis polyprenyl glycosylphosphotransferase n=1 Tax=Candidatus Mcinerneyibacterium aminivorans TaxID=2703815 RepID=A0A5D0MJH0_9BACT|nr:MAG: exopolysaccharide biosynthesis polyprenyl glycosylphosphotransferase [Candidatus Mcinerneyibacterium aminivorans]